MPGSENQARNWLTYWEQLPEGQLLFAPESEEYVQRLTSTFPLAPSQRLLDFGCGYGAVAAAIASRVAEVYLWDASEAMRRHALTRLAPLANVHWLDLSRASVPEVRLDWLLVNSVVQYMSQAELSRWLTSWEKLLAPDGKIVISDLIAPGHRPLSDLLSLLCFSFRKSYLLQAFRNVLHERKRYEQTRQNCPLFHVERSQMARLAEQAGLHVHFLSHNLTHFRDRYTAVLTKRSTS